MRKPSIAIKLTARMYTKLVDLANRVHEFMDGNANYGTPSPSLGDLQTATTNVSAAIAQWGPIGNRGSHADLVDLQTKARILHDMLKAESQYVQLTAQAAASTDYVEMANILVTSGFELASVPSPQGVLQKVQNFHQFISRQINPNMVKLKWKRPLNVLSAGNVKQYKVFRSDSTDFGTAVDVGSATRTTFTDTNSASETKTWTYWIVPCNGAGDGVLSDPVTVAVLGI